MKKTFSPLIFWLAGESSGDLHAALVMKALKDVLPNARHVGIGGPRMQAEGLKPLYPFKRFAVMGFVEVIKHLFFFWKVLRGIKSYMYKEKPDLCILVDYPGLNMRIANIADHARVPVLYYICPQFWAWKHERVFKLKAMTRHVACILPFEEEMLNIHSINCSFVGHPISEEIDFELNRDEFAAFWRLDKEKKWLAFFPGSRENEVKRMLDIFLDAAALFDPDEYEFLFSRARSVDHNFYMETIARHPKLKIHVIDGYTYEMMKYASFAVSTSGTATLECAYIGTPVAICYKANFISYLIGKHVVRIKRIGLPNIILEQDLLPELIQNELTAKNVHQVVSRHLADEERMNEIKSQLAQLQEMLSEPKPSEVMPKLILELLERYARPAF